MNFKEMIEELDKFSLKLGAEGHWWYEQKLDELIQKILREYER